MSSQDVAAQIQPTDQVFLRRASGLIRTAGTYDVFIFNIGLISVGIAVALNQLYGPSFYPGANVAVSSLVATVGMVVVGLAYYLWSITFPRSGGNYVYQSRGVSPWVAFGMTFMESLILLFYVAFAAWLLATVGLSAGFATLGFIADNETLSSIGVWFGSPAGVFITGAAIIAFCALLPLYGMRRFFSFQRGMFVLAIVGTVVALGVLLFGSRETFVSNFEGLTGLEYAGVISTAIANEWGFDGYGAGPTIAFQVWPLLPLLGGVLSIGIGGEIKKVSRAQSLGIIGSIMTAGLLFVAFSVLSNRTFGYEFQGAIAYNAFVAPEGSTEVTPWFTLLAGILTNNVWLTLIIVAGFAAWIYFWIPAMLIYSQRVWLAWSFDRLTPTAMGYVSPRFHTPVVSILLSALAAVAFLAVIAFTSYGGLVLIIGILLAWGITMVAGIFFPWVRKDLFERSPAAKYRIGGLPLMSVASFLGAGYFAWSLWLLLRDPIARGENFGLALGSNVVLLGVGLVLYWMAWAVRRRQGIRVELAFKEIPIE